MSPTDRDQKLDAAIAAYYREVEAGRTPDRDAFLREHAELRTELESFLADKAAFERQVVIDPNATLPPGFSNRDVAGSSFPVVRYFGDYELVEEIARGGMGIVYRARQVSLNRTVAVKMILTGQLASPADVQRFRTEAEAAANLDHPNILPVYEVGEFEGQQYFSMKLIEGGNLADRVKEYVGRPRDAADTLAKVARAVHYAHLRGVLHRDLKPANILLGLASGGREAPGFCSSEPGASRPPLADLVPYVTDFGLAKRVEGDSGLTQTGAIIGTPSYMAPEQARAEKQLTTAADVYALGAILYECLTGRPPFVGTTPLDTVLQVLEKEPTRPTNTDRDLATVAMKCLEKEPGKRYESAAALADELERWSRGEAIAARPTTTRERTWRWCRRNPAFAGMAAALVLALVVGTIVSGLFAAAASQRAEDARQSAADAIVARDSAANLTVQANDEAMKAKAARADAERSLYFNSVALAQQYWRSNNVGQSDRILKASPDEFRGWEWRYLHRLCHAELLNLPGNGQFTTSIHFSRDGKRMAAVSIYGLSGARVWDLAATPPKALIEISSALLQRNTSCTAGAISPDGVVVALGDSSGGISLWKVATGLKLRDIGRLGAKVERLDFQPDGTRLAATGREELKVFDTESGRVIWTQKAVAIAAFVPDNKHIFLIKPFPRLMGPNELILQLCNSDNGTVVRDLGRHTNVGWSANNDLMAMRERDIGGGSTLRVTEIATGKEVFTAPVEGNSGDVAIRADGRLVACSNKFGSTIQVWDVVERRLVRTLRGHTGSVNAIEFSPDGRLASCSWDNTIKFWDAGADQEFVVLPNHAASVVSNAAYNSDGSRLAIVQGDNVGSALPFLFGDPGAVVTVWNPVAGRATQVLKGHAEGARRVTFSADDRRLASGGRDGILIVWDCVNGTPVAKWKGHDGRIEALALSPNGQLLASAHEPKEITETRFGRRNYWDVPDKVKAGTVKVWNATSGQLRLTLSGHPSTVYAIAFSPDGRLIASASYEQIRLWDASTGVEVGRIENPRATASCMNFSPDGRTLIIGTGDNNAISVWNVADRRFKFALVGHAGGRYAGAAMSPDNRRIATGMGHEIKIWDAGTGYEIITLPLPPGNKERVPGVDALTFTPNGRRLLALLNDGTNVAWDASPPK